MAINKNHEFEDLKGIKCAIVERNVAMPRVVFLQNLLEHNGFEVIVIASPPPKTTAAVPVSEEADTTSSSEHPVAPQTYTIGVTDLTFNPVNAIFGRLLKTADDTVVTLAYWQQLTASTDDSVPYFNEHTKS